MGEMSGQEIYDNFQNGGGPEGLSTGAAMVRDIAKRYVERAFQIQQLAADMEAAWQGGAADGARRGAGPLVAEHAAASSQLLVSEDLTDRQSGSFSRARNSVVPVPAAPSEVPPWGPLSPDWTPYAQGVKENHDAARHNVDVMTSYSGASSYNTDGLPAGYGTLAGDQAGVGVGGADTIDSESFRDPGDHTYPGPGGEAQPRGPFAEPKPGQGTGPDTGPATGPASHAPVTGGGITTPGSYVPGHSPGGPAATGGPAAGPTGGPGTGVGGPGAAYWPGDTGRGVRGATPNGGPGARGAAPGGPGPRGAAPVSGPRGAAPVAGLDRFPERTVTGPGPARGARPGMNGMPMGGGRGKGDDDTEHPTPSYLEGGDPEDLFGSEVLTAPPVIGGEDDD